MNRGAMRNILLFTLSLWLGFAPSVTGATVEEVIAKHIEAKGGVENWERVESMRVAGEFTAFSKVSPFTLHRKRDRKFHLDHTQNERRIVIGHDGELLWWDSGFAPGGPQPVRGPADIQALEREIDFTTPFFDYKERGFAVALLEDKNEIEGIPAIALELKRGDESVETWYLDPDSYLEVARESPGSDFGRPQPSRTFFDEFREIEGVKIPHYVETQWYTRDRIMDIAEVELNVEIDDALFGLPNATGMDIFQNMLGEWEVKVESKQSPREPEFTESQASSVVTASLNGGMVEEHYSSGDGTEQARTYSYDRYRERYVMTQMDDAQTYLDIQVGSLEDSTLTVSNLETETTVTVFGTTVNERCTLSEVTPDGFKLQVENSMDGGENWMVMQKLTYARKAAE